MAFQVDILTVGGKVFTVTAKDDWSVWKLKCAVEKQTGTHPSLQKLVSGDGNVLPDGPLCKCCSLHNGPVQIYVVNMPKSQEELDWCEKWCNEAPHWFKRLAEEALDNREVQAFRAAAAATAAANPRTITGPHFVYLRYPNSFPGAKGYLPENHPTKVLQTTSEKPDAKAQQQLFLKTSREVLAVVKRSRLNLDCIDVDGQEVTLRWSKSHASHMEQKATLEAAVAAIVEEPSIMLDPIGRNACMDVEEIVNLMVPILAKHSGLYERLPEYLTEDPDILYAALKGDPALKAQFLKTADRNEIRKWKEWQWPKAVDESRCRWSTRCRDDL